MPFNTYSFILFFIIVLCSYHSLSNWQLKKYLLLLASYLFYSAWNPIFVCLLYFSTLVDWHFARKINKSRNHTHRKAFVLSSLSLNLGLLAFFKYGTFISQNFIALINSMGFLYQPATPSIILPVGISFYTFQTISYTIDVYRKNIKPSNSFTDYALYVSFFPQLVAGPIVRANQFLPQCEAGWNSGRSNLGIGLCLLTSGLFLKVIGADTLFGPIVNEVYQQPGTYCSLANWLAIFSFSGQIFCDFSGYSTCAVGVALCLGFQLPDNFKGPYWAHGVRDFWRRWHITLSTWLRDYVYISLGGNRVNRARIYFNLFITMLIGGFWHGASWLFVLWGSIHGILVMLELAFSSIIPSKFLKGDLVQILINICTFVAISIIWVFFRADSLDKVSQIISQLFIQSASSAKIVDFNTTIMAVIALLIMIGWNAFRHKHDKNIGELINMFPSSLIYCVIVTQLFCMYLFASGDDSAFIYFQF